MKFKLKIFRFVFYKILRGKPNTIVPLWLQYLFFPVISYYQHLFPNKNIIQDFRSCNYIIHGQSYPIQMFEELKGPAHTQYYYAYQLSHDKYFEIKMIVKEKNENTIN